MAGEPESPATVKISPWWLALIIPVIGLLGTLATPFARNIADRMFPRPATSEQKTEAKQRGGRPGRKTKEPDGPATSDVPIRPRSE